MVIVEQVVDFVWDVVDSGHMSGERSAQHWVFGVEIAVKNHFASLCKSARATKANFVAEDVHTGYCFRRANNTEN